MNKANATKEDTQGISPGQTEGNQSGRIDVRLPKPGDLLPFVVAENYDVLGVRYRVQGVDYSQSVEIGGGEPFFGCTDRESKTIYINIDEAPNVQTETFLHELVHAVSYEVYRRERVPEMSEEQVERVSAELYRSLSLSGLLPNLPPVAPTEGGGE